MSEAAFDQAAEEYDAIFTESLVGKAQRAQVWQYIDRLKLPVTAAVFEVNCGTGEDALQWAERGHPITATDISEKMIEKCRSKYPEIPFRIHDMRTPPAENPDIVFSDFGGLNCLAPSEVKAFFLTMHAALRENGLLILVVMGKKCLWDRFFQLTKGRFDDVFRRSKQDGIPINVDGKTVLTHYYSPRDLKKWSHSLFQTEIVRPVGLFVPPSYLAPFFNRYPRVFAMLRKADRLFSFSAFSDYADHYLIVLRKQLPLINRQAVDPAPPDL